jgi:hypothetical protein
MRHRLVSIERKRQQAAPVLERPYIRAANIPPKIQNDGMQYGQPFWVDVVFGDPILEEPERSPPMMYSRSPVLRRRCYGHPDRTHLHR